MQMRECLSGRGGRESHGQGHGAQGAGTNEHNVSATNTQEYEGEDDADTSTIITSKQGGQNGCGFGRGTYGKEVALESLGHWLYCYYC
jgi:hypothetical protein